ncbi:MAG: hypothetical protein KA771_07450 [Spirochaetales bacterium]|nr:hypothetical protein [Spirochaetales bacterium]
MVKACLFGGGLLDGPPNTWQLDNALIRVAKTLLNGIEGAESMHASLRPINTTHNYLMIEGDVQWNGEM